MKIQAMEFKQGGKTMYVTKLPAGVLVRKAKIDVYDPSTGRGYQRALSQRRIKDFSAYVREAFKVSPLSVLIAIRNPNALHYSQETNELEISDEEPWWVVDGQHRIKGLEDAISQDRSIENYEMPVIIMPVKNLYEEALQFLIINKTQKPVRTDLAERILKEAREQKGLEELTRIRAKGALRAALEGIEWRPDAIEIADYLSSDPNSVWYRRIKKPNERNRDAVVAQKSFTDSLEPILTHPFFGTLKTDTLIRVLNNYWNAIKEIYPEAFENPKNYILQKTTGVFVFHMLFPRIAEKMRNERGQYILTQEKFKEILDLMEDRYKDSEIWRSSNRRLGIEGGMFASMGTSMKNFRIIYEILYRSIENGWERKGREVSDITAEVIA